MVCGLKNGISINLEEGPEVKERLEVEAWKRLQMAVSPVPVPISPEGKPANQEK